MHHFRLSRAISRAPPVVRGCNAADHAGATRDSAIKKLLRLVFSEQPRVNMLDHGDQPFVVNPLAVNAGHA